MADGRGGAAAPSAADNNNRSNSSAPLDGAFLLQLLRNPPNSQPQYYHQQQSPLSLLPRETLSPNRDPAVAAVGYPLAPHNFIRPPSHRQDPPFYLSSPPLPSSFPPAFSRDQWAPPGFSGSPPLSRGDPLRNSPAQHNRGGKSLDLRDRARGRGNGTANLEQSTSAGGGYWHKSNSMTMMHSQPQHFPFDVNRHHTHHHTASPGSNRASTTQRHGIVEQTMPPPTTVRNLRPVVGPDWLPSKGRRDNQHAIDNNNNNVDRRGYNHREGNGGPFSIKQEFSSNQGGGRSDVQQTSQSSRQFDQFEFGGIGRNYGRGFSAESDRGGIVEEGDDIGSSKSSSRDLDDLANQLEESSMLGEDNTENHVAKHSSSSRGKVKYDT